MVLFKKKDKSNAMKVKEGCNIQELSIKEPVFLRDFSKSKKQVKSLREIIRNINNAEKKKLLEASLERILKCQNSEEEITARLKKAKLPMVFMHDLNLVHNGKVAELDFVILSNRFVIILETKNFSNYLAVNRGEESGFMHVEDGTLSPESRNERHKEFLREIINHELPQLNLDIRNAVVCEDKKHADGVELSSRVIGVDELVLELEKFYDKSEFTLENRDVNDIIMSITKYNKPVSYDYINRFDLKEDDFIQKEMYMSITTI